MMLLQRAEVERTKYGTWNVIQSLLPIGRRMVRAHAWDVPLDSRNLQTSQPCDRCSLREADIRYRSVGWPHCLTHTHASHQPTQGRSRGCMHLHITGWYFGWVQAQADVSSMLTCFADNFAGLAVHLASQCTSRICRALQVGCLRCLLELASRSGCLWLGDRKCPWHQRNLLLCGDSCLHHCSQIHRCVTSMRRRRGGLG